MPNIKPLTIRRAALPLVLLLATAVLVACGGPATPDPTATPPAGNVPADTAPDGAPGGGGAGAPGNVGPGDPIGGPIVGRPPVDGDGDGSLRVEPEPGIVNARAHAWDHISIAPDGRTITVYYWGGVQDCYGLAGVTAERDDDGVLHVTVFEGQRGNVGQGVACIEIALLKSVVVTLDDPLVAPAD